MRDLHTIDQELSVLAGIRRRARIHGGPREFAVIDQLLDERNDVTRFAAISGELVGARHSNSN